MAEQADAEWPTCKLICTGIRLASSQTCLFHATQEESDAELKRIGEAGEIDARGVTITLDLLDRILEAVPRGERGEPQIKSCRFDGATFKCSANFGGTVFSGNPAFAGATFEREASFHGAIFSGGAWFDDTVFKGVVEFDSVTFSGRVRFDGAAFHAAAWFNETSFSGGAWFGKATFGGATGFAFSVFNEAAIFSEVTFSGIAGFNSATFHGDADFGRAMFCGDADFDGVQFEHTATFRRAQFEQARQFGPLLADQGLVLDEVQFAQPVQIEASSIHVCCSRARFSDGVQFRLRWACVVLDDTDLAAPSILAGIPRLSREHLVHRETQIANDWKRLSEGRMSGRPHLVSLRRANVAGLGLSNVMAADCRFVGAHNLDKLRLESDVVFEAAPPTAGLAGQRGSGREVIAEERAWRANRSARWWTAPWWPDWLDDQQPSVESAERIAGLYRALRKGREDSKDEPGAADFYYGEMEMRRHARRGDHAAGQRGSGSRGRVERVVLTAYWLVSGYGLRAWRAVACLAVVVALLAVAFHQIGFAVPPRPVSYWTSLLYAFRATLSLADDKVALTAWGQLLQAVLRLTGPVLLGLALLALRGRVKR